MDHVDRKLLNYNVCKKFCDITDLESIRYVFCDITDLESIRYLLNVQQPQVSIPLGSLVATPDPQLIFSAAPWSRRPLRGQYSAAPPHFTVRRPCPPPHHHAHTHTHTQHTHTHTHTHTHHTHTHTHTHTTTHKYAQTRKHADINIKMLTLPITLGKETSWKVAI